MKLLDRETAMEHFLQQHVYEGWTEDLLTISDSFNKRQVEIEAGLMAALEDVCKQAAALQQEGIKGPIHTLYLSFMRTSLLDGGRAYYWMDAHDRRWFLDPVECYSLWHPDFIFGPLLVRRENWEKHRRLFARQITPMDLDQILQIEAVKYHLITVEFLRSLVPQIIASEALNGLLKEDGFTLHAGEYRDETTLLCRWGNPSSEQAPEAAEQTAGQGEPIWTTSF